MMPKLLLESRPKTAAKAGKALADKRLAMLSKLLAFDRKHRFSGRSRKPQCHLIGTDEVGRGCLAGPVVAAAVILPELPASSPLAVSLSELNDSKKLNPIQRERMSLVLQDVCIWSVGEASPQEINQINILQASLLAMRRAVEKLSLLADLTALPILVLIDGNKKVPNLEHIQQTVIDGDAKSASVAAASIIAKVYRDGLMRQLAEEFPAFDWHQNKGYGSRTHRQALKDHGMTEWHRHLFCQKILAEQLTFNHFLNGETPDDLSEEAFEQLDQLASEI
jgi:ribonuclease HII